MTRPSRDRRLFLGAMAGFWASAAWPLQSVPAADAASRTASIDGWARRIRGILERGRVPIIDMEATYMANATNVDRMMDFMDRMDVAQITFAAAGAPNSAPSLDLHRKYPDRFIPTTNSGEFPRWWQNPIAFLNGVARDLETADYYLMGEYEFRHYPSPEQINGPIDRDITIDLAGPAGHALFKLAEDTGVAFQLHYEIEDRLLPALETMLAGYPKAKVIWCHLGMVRYPERARRYGPDYVGGLIARFQGLHFDLAVPGPNSVYKPSGARDSTLYDGNQLASGWKALIEKHPDRFLSASDYRPPLEQGYPEQISRQRNLVLPSLSPSAQRLVAFGNAWRLITGTAWDG